MTKDYLSVTDCTLKETEAILDLAKKLKKEVNDKKKYRQDLKDKTLVMIFEKPSLRTRLSFEVGMTQLGGHAVYLSPSDIGMGQRESISDIANVVSRIGDIVMARVFDHAKVQELAKHSKVPVINALSDREHPCQALADALTMLECKKTLKGLRVAFVGDGENNVVHSLALMLSMFGAHFTVAAPKGYTMKRDIVVCAKKMAEESGGSIKETSDPTIAVRGADVVYADTWISMGDESERAKREKIFRPYQVTRRLMSLAKKDAIFMHDLPAYRGNEVEVAVIDGPQSVVFQQAENRLHAQKALILYLLDK